MTEEFISQSYDDTTPEMRQAIDSVQEALADIAVDLINVGVSVQLEAIVPTRGHVVASYRIGAGRVVVDQEPACAPLFKVFVYPRVEATRPTMTWSCLPQDTGQVVRAMVRGSIEVFRKQRMSAETGDKP